MKPQKTRTLRALERVSRLEQDAGRQALARSLDAQRDAQAGRDHARAERDEALQAQGRANAVGALIDVSRYAIASQHGAHNEEQLRRAEHALAQAEAERQAAAEAAVQAKRKQETVTARAESHEDRLRLEQEAKANWESLERWLGWGGKDV